MVGAVERVRPKMMTVVAIMAGLLPIMWSTGTGSEVMQRIAVPMIGGMVSSTLLTLIVIPAIYGVVKGWRLPFERRVAGSFDSSIIFTGRPFGKKDGEVAVISLGPRGSAAREVALLASQIRWCPRVCGHQFR